MTERGPNGMTLENWRRSLKLQTTIVLIGLEKLRGLFGAKSLIAQLPQLAAAAKTPAEREKVASIRAELESALSEEAESLRLERKSSLNLETLDDVMGELS